MKVKRIGHAGVVARDVDASRKPWAGGLIELAQLTVEGNAHGH